MQTIIPDYQPPAVSPNVKTAIWLEDDYLIPSDVTLYGVGLTEPLITQYDIFRHDLTNYGTIWAEGTAGYAALYSGKITNSGMIAAVATRGQIVAVGTSSHMDGIDNSGTIFSRTSGASAIGIWDWSGLGVGDPAIINSGTIVALSDEVATAIRRENGGAISNMAEGEILAEGRWATALDVRRGRFNPPESDPADVLNAGLIEAISTDHDSPSIGIYATVPEADRFVVVNSGIIRADYAIYIDIGFSPLQHTTETVQNLDGGLIEGLIHLGWGDDKVTNNGLIVGSIELGDDNDIYDGRNGQIVGTVYGGDGDDVLIGGTEDNTLDGGNGDDTAGFAGNRSAYTIAEDTNGALAVHGPDGTDTLRDIEFAQFNDQTVRVRPSAGSGGADIPIVPSPTDWRFLADDAQFVTLGGKGQVFGTAESQQIVVAEAPGMVSFDASFNQGGDSARLSGNANDWLMVRSGSSAILTDGSTFVQIPVGPIGMAIIFDDGARNLVIDTANATIKLGTQTLTASYVPVGAPSQMLNLPDAIDSNALGRLLMNENGSVIVRGDMDLYGSPGDEHIVMLGGEIRFDGSFNSGGDTIELQGNAGTFTARTVGSAVLLEKTGASVQIPFGLVGTKLAFTDADHALFLNGSGNVLIDGQIITGTAAPLSFA